MAVLSSIGIKSSHIPFTFTTRNLIGCSQQMQSDLCDIHTSLSLTHSPTHPPTHPLSLTHSPTHTHSSTTHSPTHPLTHSPTHPLTHSPTHPLTHSLTQSITHPLTRPKHIPNTPTKRNFFYKKITQKGIPFRYLLKNIASLFQTFEIKFMMQSLIN